MAMNPHHDFQVLRDRLRRVTADFTEHIGAEDAEAACDQYQAVEPAPTEPALEKTSQVFHHLHHLHPVMGKPHLGDAPGGHQRPVGHADDSARCHHAPILHSRSHHAKQGILFQDGVGVHGTDPGRAHQIDGGIQCVAFASLGLVDDQQARVQGGDVETVYGSGRDQRLIDKVGAMQGEGTNQFVQSFVVTSVVYDDHFESGVVHSQQSLHTFHNRRLFVVCWDQHGYGGNVGSGELQPGGRQTGPPRPGQGEVNR